MREGAQIIAVVVVPFPAQGHLNQLLNFALRLSSLGSGQIQVHYAGPAAHIRQVRSRSLRQNSTSITDIHFHDLPLPPITTPSPDPDSPIKFPSHLQPLYDELINLQAPVSSLLLSLSATFRRVILVHEPIMTFIGHTAASIPNAETFSFQCVPACFKLSFSFVHDENDPLSSNTLEMILTRFDGCYTQEFFDFVMNQVADIGSESGTLINTCRLIEGEFVDLLAQQLEYRNKKLFAVGPLFPIADAEEKAGARHRCIDWLDEQPRASVMYVSFGTTSTLSDDQIEELAIGLQCSKQRFLWVLRDADNGDIFADEGRRSWRKLPAGFEEGIEGTGIVVRDWAPQLEILAHASIGCFLSHCGWNSCMESFAMGVPIVAWPIHSDQPRNAKLVTDYLKVGVLVRDWARREETVKAKQIQESIERVMLHDEGKEIRRRMESLSEVVRRSAMDGGSSRQDLKSFVDYITR